jgi:hypothetical protein
MKSKSLTIISSKKTFVIAFVFLSILAYAFFFVIRYYRNNPTTGSMSVASVDSSIQEKDCSVCKQETVCPVCKHDDTDKNNEDLEKDSDDTALLSEKQAISVFSKDSVKKGWVHIRNEQYGFEFSYPESFVLEEYPWNKGDFFTYNYSVTDNSLGKKMYEVASDSDLERYGSQEKFNDLFGEVPSLAIRVIKNGDQKDSSSFWGENKKVVWQKMQSLGIDRSVALNALSLFQSYGNSETDPVTLEKKYVNEDSCRNISLEKINKIYAIEGSDCYEGPPFPFEETVFLGESGYIVDVFDFASEYAKYYKEILNTFRFF